ncbi:MAG: leucine-rich repeat domain-containing protein [Acholeplasmatales bacterium]|nr:leucine-rich repeat domain-containing protein [Acholeplasmatales bacterium]
MNIFKKVLLTIGFCSLPLLAISCKEKEDEFIESIRTETVITTPVDSKYVQPDELFFIYCKEGKKEYLEIEGTKSIREEINIAPKYSGLDSVSYFSWYNDSWVVNPNVTTKKIIFPDTMESIDGYATYQFQNLEEIVLPKDIKYIGSMVLITKSNIKNISLSDNNKYYKVLDNKLYDIKNDRLIKAFNITDDSINISGCKQIGDRAFYSTNLTSIVFGEGIEEISGDSIMHNDNLASITLPSSLKNLVNSYHYGMYPDDYKQYSIFTSNSNLKTIYNYSDIELDLSELGIEVIKMNNK